MNTEKLRELLNIFDEESYRKDHPGYAFSPVVMKRDLVKVIEAILDDKTA
ncbi:MAG: hypothetical protein ACRD9Q_02105 [Nitrososphaeraceae archaeon]